MGSEMCIRDSVRTEFEYLMSVDPSEGVIDPTVITILDPDGNEVVHWREKLVPDDIVKLVDLLAKHYNNAKVMVESNGIGQYVLNSLISQYFYTNLWFEDGKPGIRMSIANKPHILATLQDYVMNDKLSFFNPNLEGEMRSFEADTMRAQKGLHDDAVMSAAMSAYGFRINPPKRRTIQQTYNDYTSQVYETENRNRRSFISRRR